MSIAMKKNFSQPKNKQISKTISESSRNELTASSKSLKRGREEDNSLEPSIISSKSCSSTALNTSLVNDSMMLDSRPLTVNEIVQLRKLLTRESQRTIAPVSGVKKVVGLIKKLGPNMGKLFSCLRDLDGKTVDKTYKVLDCGLEDVAEFKSGEKSLGDKTKKWQCWALKEGNEMVLGTYEEEIVDNDENLL